MSPTLITARLRLRPVDDADAPAIVRYLNNFAVSGNLARVPYPYLRTDVDRWLATRMSDPPPGETDFGIELGQAGYVGQIGFHMNGSEPELGYWLGEPFWHRGLMTEAARAVIDWFFAATPEPAIRSGVFAFNKASLAVQRKLGFTETGTSRRHCLARGEEVRHIDTVLTRGNWQGARS